MTVYEQERHGACNTSVHVGFHMIFHQVKPVVSRTPETLRSDVAGIVTCSGAMSPNSWHS